MAQRLGTGGGRGPRRSLGEFLARDEIKDPRVRGAGLITVTHVRVSGDLQHARALFTVHDADAAALERVRQGLENASGYFRQAIARRLRMRVAPAVSSRSTTCSSRPNASRSCCARTVPRTQRAPPEPERDRRRA